MKFTKPDEKTIKRMTSKSLSVLIETLETQRAALVKPYDTQIEFYKELREQKRKEEEALRNA